MMRKSELKRTPFKVKAPAAEPKVRMRKCVMPECRKPFSPRTMQHVACSIECALAHVDLKKAQKDRKDRQEGLAKLKRRADYLAEAQRAFNAFIRQRDKDQPCICCGRVATKVQGLHSHGWDCGHYRSTGSAPHMRFIEDNAHRQLVLCNRHGAGRAVDYRIGLIARIGLARVEALEADQAPRKYTIPELQELKAHYKSKLKQLQAAAS